MRDLSNLSIEEIKQELLSLRDGLNAKLSKLDEHRGDAASILSGLKRRGLILTTDVAFFATGLIASPATSGVSLLVSIYGLVRLLVDGFAVSQLMSKRELVDQQLIKIRDELNEMSNRIALLDREIQRRIQKP